MEELVKTLAEISARLDHMKSHIANVSAEMAQLEADKTVLVKKLIDQNGWSTISVGDEKWIPCQHHNGDFGLRKL